MNDDTLVLESPEYVPGNLGRFVFDKDSQEWEPVKRIAPTQLECAEVNPYFASVKLAYWHMPEEVKRTWHFSHAMPEFFSPRPDAFAHLFKKATHGTAANPIVLE